MREISGLAKFGYFCVGLFGGLFGVLAAWFMGKDGWGWSEGGKLFADAGEDREVEGFGSCYPAKERTRSARCAVGEGGEHAEKKRHADRTERACGAHAGEGKHT